METGYLTVRQQQSVTFKVCGYCLFLCFLDSASVAVFNGDVGEGRGWGVNSPSILVACSQTNQQTLAGQQVTTVLRRQGVNFWWFLTLLCRDIMLGSSELVYKY